MAVNETIVTGRKFRKLIDEATKLWQRISFWTKASDVEFDDGSDAETKFGAINGVTDSLTSTSSNVAASAAAVKTLNDKITELSSNLSMNLDQLFADKKLSVTVSTTIALHPGDIAYQCMCIGHGDAVYMNLGATSGDPHNNPTYIEILAEGSSGSSIIVKFRLFRVLKETTAYGLTAVIRKV